MLDLVRLRNANIMLWNHMNQPKTGPEVPIGHDNTFPIISGLVDTLQEMQTEAKALLQIEIEHDDALGVEKNALDNLNIARDADPLIDLKGKAKKDEKEIEAAHAVHDEAVAEADKAFQAAHNGRAALGDQVVHLKKRLAAKLAPAILQLDLIAASTGIELHAAVPSYFNSFAAEKGLVGVNI